MNISQWLVKNRLDHDLVFAILAGCDPDKTVFSTAALRTRDNVDLGEMKDFLTKALAPALEKLFPTPVTGDFTPRIRVFPLSPEKNLPSHIVPNTDDDCVDIFFTWDGSAMSQLYLAHEFGRALQILLSGGVDEMPALAQDTCGFLAQMALLDHCIRLGIKGADDLLAHWQEEHVEDIRGHGEVFRSELADPYKPFQAEWRFPLARIAAHELFTPDQRHIVPKLFSSGANAIDVLDLADICPLGPIPQNPFPALKRVQTGSVTEQHQALGAMLLLDLLYLYGEPEKRLKDYVSDAKAYLAGPTLFIATDSEDRPFGYISWKAPQDGEPPRLTRLCAPFGNSEEVKSELGKHSKQELHGKTVFSAKVPDGSGKKTEFFARIGYAAELLTTSKTYRDMPLEDCFNIFFTPPIWAEQCRFFADEAGNPLGMVTWAWLSEHVKQEVKETGRPLTSDEWGCGPNLCIMDVIAPTLNAQVILETLTKEAFRNHMATLLARNPDVLDVLPSVWVGSKVVEARQRRPS